MLLGFDTMLPRRLFAEVQKPADLRTKPGESAVRMRGETTHINISYHDMLINNT